MSFRHSSCPPSTYVLGYSTIGQAVAYRAALETDNHRRSRPDTSPASPSMRRPTRSAMTGSRSRSSSA